MPPYNAEAHYQQVQILKKLIPQTLQIQLDYLAMALLIIGLLQIQSLQRMQHYF